jgi:hypothetical protein
VCKTYCRETLTIYTVVKFCSQLQQLAALYSTKVLRDRGISFHVVVPVDDVHVTNKDTKTVKQIVGMYCQKSGDVRS